MNRLYHELMWGAMLTCALFTTLFSLSAQEPNSAKSQLQRLIQGNQRYVNSETVCHKDWSAERTALLKKQRPFAIIVACSDSRMPPEIIFDQSIGNLFVVRVAGNIIDDIAIGSIEYGVDILGAHLVVVLGHSNCGAVNAALKGMKFDNHIQNILNAIQPAIIAIKEERENRLEKAVKANIKIVREQIKSSKPLLSKLIEKGTVYIVGAYYNLATGKVEFID